MSYEPKVYRDNGGDRMVVASGGTIQVLSGGIIEVGGNDIAAELAAVDSLADEFAAISGLTASSAELNVLDGVTAGTVTASKGVVVGATKNLDTLDLTAILIGTVDRTAALSTAPGAVAAGYKVARGVTAVTGTADVTTGLATVVAVVASMATNPAMTAYWCTAAIGGVAGHVDLKVWKPTAAADVTPLAGTTVADIHWIAIGT